MLKSRTMRQAIRFGPYAVDPDHLVLRKHGVRIKLQRQPFKLLLLLIRHRGMVVDRDAMIQELWGDGTQVDFDRGLNFCISQIRTALNDDSASPKYIETVHREGYRFLAEVDLGETEAAAPSSSDEPAAEEAPPAAPDRRRAAVWAVSGIAAVTGAGLLLSRFVQRPRAAPRPPVPLTGLAGRLAGPSFSPDAKQVAFAWSKEGRPSKSEIHVKLIGSVETLKLTSGDAFDEFPRWAPDGKSIVFTRVQGQDAALWQVPALGGPARRIASIGPPPLYGHSVRRPFDVLPAGGFLASVREPGRGWSIVRLGENGEPGPAVTSPLKGYFDHHPTVSPDGRSFVFFRSENGGLRELHVQPLAGGRSTRLAPGGWRASAAWTPDSKAVLFCAYLKNVWGIWLVGASGGEPRLVHGTSTSVHDVSLSASGKLAVYTEENPRVDLWQAPLRESGEPRPLITSARVHDSPRFSPDGKRLTFYSDRARRMQVWIANADGTEAHPLTNGLYPAWSPDGKRLAYLLEDGLHTIAAEGGLSQTVLAPDGFFKTRPFWSPDGQWIYYESNRGGGLDIWRIPANAGSGTKATPVKVSKSGGLQAQVFEGFVYYRKPQVGTMRVPLAGGEEELMAPEGTAFTVMPGGIYVLLRDMQLLLVDRRTRAARPLCQLNRASGGSSIAISADEKYAVYAYEADAGHEIMLVRDVDWR